ncbi:MAG: hypothetical protein ACTSQP_21265, partial [Promethearchaeota archaeon]
MSDLFYANLPEKNYFEFMRNVDKHIEQYRQFLINAINYEERKELKLEWQALDDKTIKEIYEENYYNEKNKKFLSLIEISNIDILKQSLHNESELNEFIEVKKKEIQEKNYYWIKIIEKDANLKEQKIINSL